MEKNKGNSHFSIVSKKKMELESDVFVVRERMKPSDNAHNNPQLGMTELELRGSSQRPRWTGLLSCLKHITCLRQGLTAVLFYCLGLSLLSLFLVWLVDDLSGRADETDNMHRFAPHMTTAKNGIFTFHGNDYVTLVMPTSGDALELVHQSVSHTSPLVRALCASNNSSSSHSMLNVVVVQLVALKGSLRSIMNEKDARQEADVEVKNCVWSHWRFPVSSMETPISDKTVAFCRIAEVRLLLPVASAADRTRVCLSGIGNKDVTPEEWLYDAAVKAGLKACSTRTPYFAVLADSLVPLGVIKRDGAAHEFEKEAREAGFIQRLLSPLRHNNSRVAAVQCTIIAENSAQNHSAEKREFKEEGLYDLRRYEVLDRGVRGAFGSTAAAAVTRFFLTQPLRGRDARDGRVQGWEEPLDGVSPFCALWRRDLFDEAGGFVPSHGSGVLGPLRAAAPSHMGWELSFRISTAQPDLGFWSSTAIAVAWHGLGLGCSLYLTEAENCRVSAFLSAARPSYALSPAQAHRWGMFLTKRIRQRVARGVWEPVKYNAPTFSGGRFAVTANSELIHVTVYGGYCGIPCCGMMMEMVHYLTPLQSWGAPFSMSLSRCSWCKGLPWYVMDGLIRTHWKEPRALLPRVPRMQRVALFHGGVGAALDNFGRRRPNGVYAVGRIITEMSRISPEEVNRIHRNLDEIWVPSLFFQSVYSRSGVRPSMIHIIPESIDPFLFDPALCKPIQEPFLASLVSTLGKGVWINRPLHGDVRNPWKRQSWNASKRRFRFLSVFKWEQRKGWDVLLKAYWKAFGPGTPHHEDVELYLKCTFPRHFAEGVSYHTFPTFINKWVQHTAGIDGTIEDFPPIVLIGVGTISQDVMLSIYHSVDAFVLPTRAEGWGIPLMEAMSMGLPVLVTNWGGPTTFCRRDNSFLISVDGLEELSKGSVYGYAPGKKYAIPSLTGLTELMRYVVDHPALAKEVGRRARQSVLANYTEEVVATQMLWRLREISRMLLTRQRYALSAHFLW
ncbi:putative mannosyltransferase-like protein [Trypanosoma rangeli]|uniref:Putative mannosyltransferase-like protein n=1 Tax=Trypanosoma rangeli TaxID=5698 RepID=A0A3R7NS98_TRYRA|nr:putative mannosyltransferase-like protein [Trypanosoma rangeli]RNF10831.1 putative mannosyltransferase-like protein [Trypanosoma rangeli]|eukprot:RNF10831.1 putative mannosyltransferase-like protein [Trypanosoma rangeli]